eukprot:517785-Amphidinium_carterae.1
MATHGTCRASGSNPTRHQRQPDLATVSNICGVSHKHYNPPQTNTTPAKVARKNAWEPMLRFFEVSGLL